MKELTEKEVIAILKACANGHVDSFRFRNDGAIVTVTTDGYETVHGVFPDVEKGKALIQEFLQTDGFDFVHVVERFDPSTQQLSIDVDITEDDIVQASQMLDVLFTKYSVSARDIHDFTAAFQVVGLARLLSMPIPAAKTGTCKPPLEEQ